MTSKLSAEFLAKTAFPRLEPTDILAHPSTARTSARGEGMVLIDDSIVRGLLNGDRLGVASREREGRVRCASPRRRSVAVPHLDPQRFPE